MDQSQIVAGKPVAVIGAGVSGLVTAKRLAGEGFQVDVFERRSQAGGLWNFSPDPSTPFASAVYGDLQTNFPRQLMELQDYPWTTQPLFMQHDLVQGYLEDYSRDIQKRCNSRVRFNFDSEVVCLFHESYTGGHWELTFQSVITGEKATRRYLYVVVAGGVYDEPFIPYYQGLSEWRQTWSDSVSHAKLYRNPDPFRGKSVLIVGYQASGFDIARKIVASVYRLWVSSTRPVEDGLPQLAIKMPGIEAFYPHMRVVRFTNGQDISEVDHIIFCTGYQYHQPFIKTNSATNGPLFPSGLNIQHLHEHIVYIEQPTLAFVGMVRDAVPTFLVVQAQAAFVARFFAGHIRSLRPRKEDPQHRLPYPLFMDYLLRLESLCEQADKARLWNETPGNSPVFRWTLELDLIRTKRREIRGAFMSQNQLMTGVWSTADILHECHCKFLTMSVENIMTLVPFLILYYGYKDDHEPDSVLPFQGWKTDFGFIIGKSIIDSYHTLSDRLGQEGNDVLSRGSHRLFSLISDRWGRWAGHCYSLDHLDLIAWRTAFHKYFSLCGRRRSSPEPPPHNPPCPPGLPPCAPPAPVIVPPRLGHSGPQVFVAGRRGESIRRQ